MVGYGVAFPDRKITRSATIHDHFESIIHFLYEEGPSTTAQVADHLKLSHYRALELLNMVKESGEISTMRYGNTRSETVARTTYWILTSDLREEPAVASG